MRRLVLPLILLAVAASRVLTWRAVFIGGDVLPYDTDPYYRLRQIEILNCNWPHTPVDYYSLGATKQNDPTVARPEPLLHPVMFVTAWLLAGQSRDTMALRRAAMLEPVLWAVFTSWLAYVVARRMSGRFAGEIAAIYAGFAMPILWRTSLGALDNHMTEASVFLVVVWVVDEWRTRTWKTWSGSRLLS